MSTLDLSKMTADQLRALIAKMAAAPANRLSFKVTIPREATATTKASAGGALSVYGLGRFPVTLYRSQWERLLGAANEINAFILANAAILTTKD